MIYVDKALSQRLERTEARANADFVETRARLFPASGSAWIDVAGTWAMFDGLESPLTQTFGLGMFDEVSEEHLDEIEAFFRERNAPVFHEVSPMTDPSLLSLLNTRGYKPVELTSVMFLDLSGHIVRPPVNPEIKTRIVDESEADRWAEVSAAGWATEHEGLADFMLAFGKIAARNQGGHPFIAEIDDRPIAAGGFQIYDDICILAGASTIPEARRMGAQNALLTDRLQYGTDRGCSLAMMCALPGSQSQKNAQKNGFSIAYTRTKWQLSV